ncbi:7384_t:CDS:2, partial [Scutellospora calospora]
ENHTLTNTSVDAEKAENSPFRIVTAKMFIDLPPKAFEDFDQRVYTYMNPLVMRYVEEFDGIVFAYKNIKCDISGYLYENSPYLIRQSPTHIALLLYESFNVKRFRGCIPDDVFEWRDDDDKQLELAKLY